MAPSPLVTWAVVGLGAAVGAAVLAMAALSIIPMSLQVGMFCFFSGWLLAHTDFARQFFSGRRRVPSTYLRPPMGGSSTTQKRKPDAITSSPAVDEQLRALIELICIEFVDNWYPSISSDVEFRETVKWVMARALHAVEERAMAVRLPDLVKDIAYLLIVHMEDFADARRRHNSAFTADLTMDEIFARRQPHFALKDTATEHEYLRQICAWLLWNIMPSGERSSEVVRLLLREIAANKILIPIVDKFSDPDFMNDIMIDLLTPAVPGSDVAKPFVKPSKVKEKRQTSATTPISPHMGSYVELSAPSSSTMSLAEDLAPRTVKAVDTPVDSTPKATATESSTGVAPPTTTTAPPTTSAEILPKIKEGLSFLQQLRQQESFGPFRPDDYADESLDEPLLPLMNAFLRVSESPKGWVYWLLMYVGKPIMRFTAGDLINRCILYGLHWLTTERRIAYYLYLLRESLWPGGRWAPDAPPLSRDEATNRREKLRTMLGNYLDAVRPTLGDAVVDRARDDIVEVLQHKTLNKHFLFVAFDVVLAHVFPEMVSASVLPYLPTPPDPIVTKAASPTSNAVLGPELATAPENGKSDEQQQHGKEGKHGKDGGKKNSSMPPTPATPTPMSGILAPSSTIRRDVLTW